MLEESYNIYYSIDVGYEHFGYCIWKVQPVYRKHFKETAVICCAGVLRVSKERNFLQTCEVLVTELTTLCGIYGYPSKIIIENQHSQNNIKIQFFVSGYFVAFASQIVPISSSSKKVSILGKAANVDISDLVGKSYKKRKEIAPRIVNAIANDIGAECYLDERHDCQESILMGAD